MRITGRKWFLRLGLLGLAGIVVFALYGRAPRLAALPNPNGYDDFVKAGSLIVGPVADYSKLDRAELEQLLASNTEPLQLLRTGLTQRCQMPLEPALNNPSGITTELGGMKHAAQLLAAEGRLRELENKPGEAARSYVDAMRFGNEMSRGALLITRLVGIAGEAIGYNSLTRIAPQLNRNECQAVLSELERLDAARVSWAEVRQAENQCMRYHLKQQLNPAAWVIGWWKGRQIIQTAESRHKTALANERLLMADLAVRCYEMDTGAIPQNLDDLVPKYLAKVPQDPFAAQGLVYQAQPPANWALYSVGPDGKDDGGRTVGRGPNAKGDIRLQHSL